MWNVASLVIQGERIFPPWVPGYSCAISEFTRLCVSLWLSPHTSLQGRNDVDHVHMQNCCFSWLLMRRNRTPQLREAYMVAFHPPHSWKNFRYSPVGVGLEVWKDIKVAFDRFPTSGQNVTDFSWLPYISVFENVIASSQRFENGPNVWKLDTLWGTSA